MVLGLGSNSVISIPTDSNGRMKITELEKSIKQIIKENGQPFCVIATVGTTITGSVDNLNEISNSSSIDMCIGVGCYPENHFFSNDFDKEISLLKQKIDLGATYAVTQMCFDNKKYFSFVDKCRKENINIRQKLSIIAKRKIFLLLLYT